jgi:hypothetical protein
MELTKALNVSHSKWLEKWYAAPSNSSNLEILLYKSLGAKRCYRALHGKRGRPARFSYVSVRVEVAVPAPGANRRGVRKNPGDLGARNVIRQE